MTKHSSHVQPGRPLPHAPNAIPRTAAGVPAGGEFAARTRTEDALEIVSPPWARRQSAASAFAERYAAIKIPDRSGMSENGLITLGETADPEYAATNCWMVTDHPAALLTLELSWEATPRSQ